MNKRKKGFLTAASIITIVASGLAILLSLLLFLSSSMFNEKMVKDVLRDSQEFTYYEEVDGSYYFIEIDEETMQEIRISSVLNVSAFVVLGVAVAKLILAIVILINNNREKFSAGTTIGLLVLSVLTMSMIETAFLIVSLCLKTRKQNVQKIEEEQIAN